MRSLLLLASLVLLGGAAQAQELSGPVRGLYFEAARGVLVDARLSRRPGAIRWADVALPGGNILVQIPAGMDPRIGEMVAVRPGEPKSSQLARVLPTTTVSRALPLEQSSVGR